jgi:hypothetical protein
MFKNSLFIYDNLYSFKCVHILLNPELYMRKSCFELTTELLRYVILFATSIPSNKKTLNRCQEDVNLQVHWLSVPSRILTIAHKD